MKFLKTKILPCLIICGLLLTALPLAVFASPATPIMSEAALIAAIDEIPQGGSGEITLQNIYMSLSTGLYIEYKDITINLVSSALSTQSEGPVIHVYGGNLTINADDNSSIASEGDTFGMGTIAVENSEDWNLETQTVPKEFNLTINGGKYSCIEDNALINANPGTNVTLTGVDCFGPVKAINMEGVGITAFGDLTINSGRFENDITQYAAQGKYVGQFGDKYYVRDKEMSDEFSAILTNGKLVLDFDKSAYSEETSFIISEDLWNKHPGFVFYFETFNDDLSKIVVGYNSDSYLEEVHTVDVVWNYDKKVSQSAQSFIENFPTNRDWFAVSDLELVNYWVHHDPNSETESFANYSGELKKVLGNSNFLFQVEDRAGSDDPFCTVTIGTAKLIHDGKVYFAADALGARGEHILYVPESTANTKEALTAAVQKRINDYLGVGKVKVTCDGSTVTDYYNNTIAGYDAEIADAQARLDAEMAKPDGEKDWMKIFEYQFTLDWTPIYKQSFIDSFGTGEGAFILTAQNDLVFEAQVVGTDKSYNFIVVKDDDKIITPTYATVDFNTKVSVKTDSSTVPLDTVIEVDKLTEGAEYDRLIDILGVEENDTFDIKLHSISLDEYVTKLEDDKFEVRIPVSEKLKDKTLVAYYVDENDEVTPFDVTLEEDGKETYACFYTYHFSVYTLAQKPVSDKEETDETGKETTVEVPKTGDSSNPMLWVVMALMSGVVLFGAQLLKKKEEI